jgi:hypothetical protein
MTLKLSLPLSYASLLTTPLRPLLVRPSPTGFELQGGETAAQWGSSIVEFSGAPLASVACDFATAAETSEAQSLLEGFSTSGTTWR